MNNIQAAYILNTSYNLLEKTACFYLLHSLDLNNVVKQFSTTCVFHDQIKFLLCFNDFVELHNLRMSDYLQNMDFSSHPFHICDVHNLSLLEDFNGNFFISENVRSQLDFSEGSLSNRLSQYVLTNGFLVSFRGHRRSSRSF